jgi:hypothetical protein
MQINKSTPLSTRKKILLILVELGVWIAFSLVMYYLWDRWLTPGPHHPIHWVGMDFAPYWTGVRAMLAGQSPYSSDTTQLIQTVLLGGPPAAGGDPMLFVYPAWIFLLILPFALLPLRLAVALWTGLLLLVIFNLIGYLAIRWGNQRPSRISLWVVVLVIGCLPFISIAVTKGQLSLVSLGALFLAIRQVDNLQSPGGRGIPKLDHNEEGKANLAASDLLAGMFLAFSILKPTLTIIAMAGMLLWALIERRPYFIAGFFASIGVLSLSSFFVVGNWIPDYLNVLNNTGGAPVLWSLALLAWPWKVLYASFFIALGILEFIIFLRTRNRVQWFSGSILLGMALFPMRWIYDLQLGILVPAEAGPLRGVPAASVVVALLAPWGLALFPETLRWPAQVIGLPLAWAIVWFSCFVFQARSSESK